MPERPSKANAGRTILVTGATGKQGGAVARHLRERGYTIRALTRDPSKPQARALLGAGAEVVRGDYDDQTSLTRALDGVYGVFSVQNPVDAGIEGEVRQGKALADAAQRAGVTHFVYASVASADRNTGIPFFDSKARIEEHIRTLGLAYTVLRPAFFMENWLGMADMIVSGTLAQPLSPETRLYQIAVDDIGWFAAEAFDRPGAWRGRALDFAGDAPTMRETAAVFSRVLGRDVEYRQIPWSDFEQRAGAGITKMYHWFEEHNFDIDVAALRREFPRLTRLETWARAQRWEARGGGRTAPVR